MMSEPMSNRALHNRFTVNPAQLHVNVHLSVRTNRFHRILLSRVHRALRGLSVDAYQFDLPAPR